MPAPETLSLGQLLDKRFEPERWVIGDGLLPIGGLMILAGQPKARKSMTLNALCHAMITATPAFCAQSIQSGGRVKPVLAVSRPHCVLVFEQELGQQEYAERWRGVIADEVETRQKLLRDNLHVRSMDFTMMLDNEGVDLIAAEIEALRPDVVCFDPLRKFHASEENSATEMSRVMRSLSILRAKYGISIIVLHHEAKPSEHRQGGAAGRGSSVVFADCDAWISQKLTNKNAGILQLQFELRRAKPLLSMTLHQDDRGMAIFSHWGKPDKGET